MESIKSNKIITFDQVIRDVESLIRFYKHRNKYGQAKYWQDQKFLLENTGDLEHFPVKYFQVHMKVFEIYKIRSKKRAMKRNIPTSMLLK